MKTINDNGAEAIQEAFARSNKQAALMPYLMAGFPTLAESTRIGEAYIEAGADLIEVGVPFTDPLADGPVIQAAGTQALAAGAHVTGVLEVARSLSASVPVVLMCYANMVYAPGADAFIERMTRSGISGLIVPDLPLEESAEIMAACEANKIALVLMAAPTTTPERLAAIGAHTKGFLYTVSAVGTTGEREALPPQLADLVQRAKGSTSAPVAVGFGIGTPEQAREAAELGADGVIIGSRVVRAAAEADDPAGAAGAVVSEFASELLRS